MFFPQWAMLFVLLALCTSACGLRTTEYGNPGVTCSQGLSECTMKDSMPLAFQEDAAVDVKSLMPRFVLCCKDKVPCTLCLVIDTELSIHPDEDMEEDFMSEHDGVSEEKRNSKAFVTVCYQPMSNLPTCKKVEFRINHTDLMQDPAKITMVISKPVGISYETQVIVYSPKSLHLKQNVVAPSLNEVCSQNGQEQIDECRVPELNMVIKQDQVELQLAGRNMSFPLVCIQYEKNGICQDWNRTTIPLYYVTPCLCLKISDQSPRRSHSCPFINTDDLQKNVWRNVSVSLVQRRMITLGNMLVWKLSAPCRLEGEVWPCHKTAGLGENSCKEMEGFRKQLDDTSWQQNKSNQIIYNRWETTGVFEDISLQVPPCVMMKLGRNAHHLGPFCSENTANRWRWSLLFVAVLLLVSLTVLLYFLLRNLVKKWVWSCHHGGLVKVGRKGHVVLLSPPDVDSGVSESVCRLGSLLCSLGFIVTVDQWSRKEQCTLGPLPWLHSKLLEQNGLGVRVVLVLTKGALERVEEWTRQHKEVIKAKQEDMDLPQKWSPYSDVFTASLFLILADKHLGRARERYLLVSFDSYAVQAPGSNMRLSELLQGLSLFQLPSQMQALLSELTLGGRRKRSGRRTWTRSKWVALDRLRAKTKEAVPHQR